VVSGAWAEVDEDKEDEERGYSNTISPVGAAPMTKQINVGRVTISMSLSEANQLFWDHPPTKDAFRKLLYEIVSGTKIRYPGIAVPKGK